MQRKQSRRESLAAAVGAAAAFRLGARILKNPEPAVISAKPRERGNASGRRIFHDEILKFREEEIGEALKAEPKTREKAPQVAAQCGKRIRPYAPIVEDALAGIAEGSGLAHEEIILVNGHHEERVYHGWPAKINHGPAIAAAPPDADDEATYVGQSCEWGWPGRWRLGGRSEGPSVLPYTYPGLLPSFGLSSAGLAFYATRAGGSGGGGGGAEDLNQSKGKLNAPALEGIPEDAVVKAHPLDLMPFDTSRREAHVRGQASGHLDECRTLRLLEEN